MAAEPAIDDMTTKILFPTDFSAPARTALAYAVDIANRLGGHLCLLHTYQMYSTAGMFVSVERYLEEDAAAELLEIVRELEARLVSGARVSSRIVRGDPAVTIANIADKEGFDLIVMGTQGASGLEEVFTGSTTNGVIRRAATPVLAIPADQAFAPVRRIVLAMDQGGISNLETVKGLLLLTRAYQAKVLVFHQDTGAEDRGVDPSVARYLESVDHSFVYELDETDVHQSINEFLRDSGAEMLCMIRRKRGFLERIFHGSITRREAFDSPAPLLVLHDY